MVWWSVGLQSLDETAEVKLMVLEALTKVSQSKMITRKCGHSGGSYVV